MGQRYLQDALGLLYGEICVSGVSLKDHPDLLKQGLSFRFLVLDCGATPENLRQCVRVRANNSLFLFYLRFCSSAIKE